MAKSIGSRLVTRMVVGNQLRSYADMCIPIKKGLVLGAYEQCDTCDVKLTNAGSKFDEEVGGKLSQLLKGSGLKRGKALVFGNLGNDFHEVAVAGLGHEGQGYCESEVMDMCKESIRVAAGAGARALQERGITCVMVEQFTNAEPAAEGAYLSVWRYQELKSKDNQMVIPRIELYDSSDRDSWERGVLKAEAQNLARRLEETPANIMTPAIFAQTAIEVLCPCGVCVEVRGRDWLESKKMTAFLSMARGSCEAPLFLEMVHNGAETDDKPVVLVGKGVTYDTGGINLKKGCEDMIEWKGDMAGAAVVLAAMKCVCQMNLPLNVIGIVPLCENMVGGLAMKPGDVVLGMNGKTIRLENTDNEGRVILADSLSYAGCLKPCLILEVSDLTMGMREAMGGGGSGLFSTSDEVWIEMKRAGAETGDRFWRFPFWKHFTAKVTDYIGVDVNNVGKGKGGDPCLGAAFLLEFIPPVDFVHIDVSGTGLISSGIEQPYLKKGFMTGRPTRSLAQFLYQIACPHTKCAPDC